MWDQKFFEIFATDIPQGFVFVFLFFTLTNIKIKSKLYVITSLIYAFATFLIRPYVNFGVHSIILLFIFVFIAVKWGKAKLLPSVIYGIAPFIIEYAIEWILFVIFDVIKFNTALLDTNAQLRALVGLIPISMTFIVSLLFFFIKKYINKSKGESNVAV